MAERFKHGRGKSPGKLGSLPTPRPQILEYFASEVGGRYTPGLEYDNQGEDSTLFLGRIFQGLNDQEIFRTQSGYVGRTTSVRAMKGDLIALVRGSQLPMILRMSTEKAGCWTLEGCCYLYGHGYEWSAF